MSSRKKTTEELGSTAARILGEGPPNIDTAMQKRAFVALAANRGQRNGTRTVRIALIAAACVAALFVAGLLIFNPTDDADAIAYRVSDERSDRDITFIRATVEPREIEFEDGSIILLNIDTNVRILQSTAANVEIDMGRGRFEADIQSAGKTNWRFHTGPYTISVVGTVFNVSWHARDTILDVEVSRGRVRVSGEGLSDHEIELIAGDHFRANHAQQTVSIESAETTKEIADINPPGTLEEMDSNKDLIVDSDDSKPEEKPIALQKVKPPTDKNNRSPEQNLNFSTDYKNGRFSKIVALATDAGIDRVIRGCSKQSLWQLADSGRRTGSVDVAVNAFSTFRQRFPGDCKAKRAAFLLGRLSLENNHDAVIAGKWFEAYLAEAPKGPLAEEALFRLMTVYRDMGKMEKRRDCAQRYLNLYPNGQYANVAASVLENK